MTKKSFFWVILTAVLVSLVLNLFAGRFLAAKISTWPLLNKWKILSPEAPIVINNHETVRVSDSGDIMQAAGQIKSKLSSVVLVNGSSDVFVGAAINLTSDGSFVSAAGVFSSKAAGDYYVILNDGTSAKISQKTLDPATGLVFFKATLNSVPVASLGNSGDVLPGSEVLFAASSLQNFGVKVSAAYVSSAQADVLGQTFQSDSPTRSFGAVSPETLALGQAVVNINSEIVGIWNGSQIISSDVLKQAQALYFKTPLSISRPSFGFSYSIIGKTDAGLIKLPEGARVTLVNPSSPAHTAGLLAGDVITQVSGQSITESSALEIALQNFKPGDPVSLTVVRKTQVLNLILTAGTLK